MAAVLRPARPGDAAGIVRVNGDTWRAAYRGLFPVAVLESRGRDPAHVERVRERIAAGNQAILVAEDAGEVVGFSMAGAPREPVPGFDAEVYAIYVLPAHQGTGLGRRLMAAAAEAVAARGSRSLFCWTLRDNPPTRSFYERLGGRLAAERTAKVEGVDVAEVAYGWEDLRPLAGAGPKAE